MSNSNGKRRHRLAFLGAVIALTAASISLLGPLRDFYVELATGSKTASLVSNLATTAEEMITQQRYEAARDFLTQARKLAPADHRLRVQEFIVAVRLQFSEAFDFRTIYNPGKHEALVPLMAEGYRLVLAASDDMQKSALQAHIALLHYFDPAGLSARYIEQLLRDALILDQQNALAWSLLGFLHQREGDTEAATSAWLEAVKHDPRDGQAWLALASQYRAQGDFAAEFDAQRMAASGISPVIGWGYYYRSQWGSADRLMTLLLDDLFALQAGESLLGLAGDARESVLEEHRERADWLLRAMAHAHSDRFHQAAELAWQQLDLNRLEYWEWNEIDALTLLRDIERHLTAEDARRLEQAWSSFSEVAKLRKVDLAGEPDPMWVVAWGGAVFVVYLTPDAALRRAGLRPGDQLISLGGFPVAPGENLAQSMSSRLAEAAPLLIDRDHQLRVVAIGDAVQ